jgi:prefoldin subunit 1
MSIPNEKLQQLLQEIQSKAQFAEQQLVLVRQQMQSQTRKKRMLELSTAEIDALPQDTRMYNGVGKMQVLSQSQRMRKHFLLTDFLSATGLSTQLHQT